MLSAATRQLGVRVEAIDGCGLHPLQTAERDFATAFAFRRVLQQRLPRLLAEAPVCEPLAGPRSTRPVALPDEILRRWPSALPELGGHGPSLAALPLDPAVRPVATRGGSKEAGLRLQDFVRSKLDRYAEDRNRPELDASSGLSPYLHFGQVGAHEVFAAVATHEGFDPAGLGLSCRGQREGWWGLSPSAEAFLDQLVTWRELAYTTARWMPGHETYATLPDWARRTLAAHAPDPRRPLYSLETLQAAATHDPLWNAAQRQLLQEGRIHNYLRMLWGKKILEWTPSPEQAHSTMLHLNDRYALDGRDPCSVAGVAWCMGRYDRPWGPERPIFGTVRFMSSANTARKYHLAGYLERFGGPDEKRA
jgi:deoxyribodipyrimidine photo-lyase